MTTRELHEHIDFQRYMIRTLKPDDKDPCTGWQAINVANPFTGEPMTNAQAFKLHAQLFEILVEREGITP